jgi:hypothetical protein
MFLLGTKFCGTPILFICIVPQASVFYILAAQEELSLMCCRQLQIHTFQFPSHNNIKAVDV